MKFRHIAIALALLAAFASDSGAQSQPTPQIQAQEKADEAPNNQPKADTNNSKIEPAPVAAPPPSANHGDQKSAAESPKSSEETSGGTEYWVYRGYKVKITDGLLVLFTLCLVIIGIFQAAFLKGALEATAIAARAADLSARAAVALELPIIRALPEGFAFGSSQDGDGPRIEYCVVVALVCSNLGRTKAFPVEVRCGFTIGDTLPDIPVYTFTKPFPIGLILQENGAGQSPQININDFEIPLADGDEGRMRNRQVKFWFYYSIAYLDFMDVRHEVGFCWRWNGGFGVNTFRVDDTPAYNRKT
jgi:hypothetical protein